MARRTCISSLSASLFAIALAAAPQAALACTDEETYLFTCATANPDRVISLCGTEEDTGEGLHWTGVRFVYRTEKGDEISYPADPSEGPRKLFFSHRFKAGLYEAQVHFEDLGNAYRLYFRDAPEGRVPEGGLEIGRDGKTVETLHCGEAPDWYFNETRQLLACDLDGPHGAQGCAPQIPSEP
jgi:hypothetical protein